MYEDQYYETQPQQECYVEEQQQPDNYAQQEMYAPQAPQVPEPLIVYLKNDSNLFMGSDDRGRMVWTTYAQQWYMAPTDDEGLITLQLRRNKKYFTPKGLKDEPATLAREIIDENNIVLGDAETQTVMNSNFQFVKDPEKAALLTAQYCQEGCDQRFELDKLREDLAVCKKSKGCTLL